MAKINYLSRREYDIWDYIKEAEIVDNELLKKIFPEINNSARNKILHNLFLKGYLKRARKDLYYNLNKLKNFYQLAFKIHEGYLGLSSALKYYGLIEYEDFTIFIITKNFQKKIDIKGTQYNIQYIPFKKYFTGFEKKDDIYISTIEKTIIDCFLKTSEIPLSITTKALYESKIDWNKFIELLKKIDNKSLHQRIGYILEMMKKETKFKVPGIVFKFLERSINNPVRLFQNKGKTLFNDKWKVQDSMGKEKILQWWY